VRPDSTTETTRESRPPAPPPLPDRVSREFLLHHRICPTRWLADGALGVAVTEDSLLTGLDDLSIAYEQLVIPEAVSPQELDLLIARLTSPEEAGIEVAARDDADAFTSDVRDLANQPPVVRYVNLLIRQAYDSGASDIHIQATRTGLDVRFRLDGVLVPGLDPPPRLDRAVVSRVKLLAELDIAECRRPQDGRIRVRLHDRELDLRVSTVPTMFGEAIVLRLLERGGGAIGLGALGLSSDLLAAMEQLVRQPHGMILVTGPTGSGKTTTLYAALALRAAGAEKIITVEDPIEYALEGVAQVPIQAQTGVTFASMLRSILRQDPDVILVGEMRDGETAAITVQAALTGHVVFSTLHTNDAVGAIPRLIDLGAAPYLVRATLTAVLAQRLVRRICDGCREPYVPDGQSLAAMGMVGLVDSSPEAFELTRGRGCSACRGTGYRGRTGLFELLVLTDGVRDLIVGQPSTQAIAEQARAAGMASLRTDGWSKVRAGITTIEEVLRVTDQ
jgi:general secretion pathway protein E